MHLLRPALRLGSVGLVCVSLGACGSISTVNGIPTSGGGFHDPCGGYPIICIVGAGLIAGGVAVAINSRGGNRSSAGAATTTSTTTPVVTPPIVTPPVVTPPVVTTPLVTTTTATPVPSDQRLKHDAKSVMTLDNGINVYSFRYLGDGRVFVGVIAQELLADRRFRSAVHTYPENFYGVDYSKLGLDLLGALEMRHAGLRAMQLRAAVQLRTAVR